MGILQDFEKAQLEKLTAGRFIPEFSYGDTIRVNVRIVEGNAEKAAERIQAFEGVCIARKTRGMRSSFTVRKMSNGEGVERIFPLHSPRIESIKVIKRGVVRRAKLYYMRFLTGKKARIKEKMDYSARTQGAAKVAAVAKS